MPELHQTLAAPDPVAKAGPTNRPLRVLVIDIGGTHVKVLATGQTVHRQFDSGKNLTPRKMLAAVRPLVADWEYDVVSMGFPGPILHHRPAAEPWNLGKGWLGFNFKAAFKRPVQMMNDAAMQALGSYEAGRMLFIGLGTGVGAAMIAENAIVPLELGDLPWNRHRESLHDVLGREGLRRFGLAEWRRVVDTTLVKLMHAFIADYVVIGGGNAKRLRSLPHGIRRGHNLTAFRGGARLWGVNDVPILTTTPPVAPEAHVALDWRML